MLKRTILLALTLLAVSLGLRAQITLGFNQWPDSGSVITYTNAFGTALLGDSGINKTWNYDTLTGFSNNDTVRIFPPRLYPGASRNLRLNSNQVHDNAGIFQFFNKRFRGSLSDVLLQGIYLTLPGGLIPGGDSVLNFEFSPAIKVFEENSTFNTVVRGSGQSNRFTIPFDTTITVPNLGAINVDSLGFRGRITYNSRFNGWGTLNLPGGSWPALREQQSNTFSISVEVFTLIRILPFLPPIPTWVPIPVPLPNFPFNSIRYWTNSFQLPTLEITTDSAGTTTLSTRFQGGIPQGLKQVNATKLFTAYPNPGNNELSIEAMSGILPEKIEIFNLTGQLIENRNWPTSSNKVIVQTAKWPKGGYLVRLQTGKEQAGIRWVKE